MHNYTTDGDISFETITGEKIRVTDTGEVGINTTTTLNFGRLQILETTNAHIYLGNGGNAGTLQVDGSGNLVFNATSEIWLNDNSHVFGTLVVDSNISSGGNIYTTGSGGDIYTTTGDMWVAEGQKISLSGDTVNAGFNATGALLDIFTVARGIHLDSAQFIDLDANTGYSTFVNKGASGAAAFPSTGTRFIIEGTDGLAGMSIMTVGSTGDGTSFINFGSDNLATGAYIKYDQTTFGGESGSLEFSVYDGGYGNLVRMIGLDSRELSLGAPSSLMSNDIDIRMYATDGIAFQIDNTRSVVGICTNVTGQLEDNISLQVARQIGANTVNMRLYDTYVTTPDHWCDFTVNGSGELYIEPTAATTAIGVVIQGDSDTQLRIHNTTDYTDLSVAANGDFTIAPSNGGLGRVVSIYSAANNDVEYPSLVLNFDRGAGNMSVDDILGKIRYVGSTSTGTDVTYGSIDSRTHNVTNGRQDMELSFTYAQDNGATSTLVKGVTINRDSNTALMVSHTPFSSIPIVEVGMSLGVISDDARTKMCMISRTTATETQASDCAIQFGNSDDTWRGEMRYVNFLPASGDPARINEFQFYTGNSTANGPALIMDGARDIYTPHNFAVDGDLRGYLDISSSVTLNGMTDPSANLTKIIVIKRIGKTIILWVNIFNLVDNQTGNFYMDLPTGVYTSASASYEVIAATRCLDSAAPAWQAAPGMMSIGSGTDRVFFYSNFVPTQYGIKRRGVQGQIIYQLG